MAESLKVLVTRGLDFIGSNLVHELTDATSKNDVSDAQTLRHEISVVLSIMLLMVEEKPLLFLSVLGTLSLFIGTFCNGDKSDRSSELDH